MVGISTPVPKNSQRAADRQISPEDFAKSEGMGTSADASLDKSHAATSSINVAYKDNYRELCNYANSFLHSQELAQDSVHQAFVGTLTTIQGGEQIRDMRGFLVSCVRNNCLSYLRKSKRESSYSLENDYTVDGDIWQGETSSVATSAEINTSWKKVRSAIDNLPSSQRFALLMAEFQGYSYEEIADRMNRSNSSVKQLISRARQKVRAKADVGADWASIPAPAIEIDRLLSQGNVDLSPSLLDLLQVKVSHIQAWMVNAFQGGVDSVAYTGVTVATGAAVVALATTSPAPPTDPVSGEPAAGSAQNKPSLAIRPTDPGSLQPGKAPTLSANEPSQSEGSADDLGPGPNTGSPSGEGKSGGDKPGSSTPDRGECVNNCSSGQSDSRGKSDAKGADREHLGSSGVSRLAYEESESSTTTMACTVDVMAGTRTCSSSGDRITAASRTVDTYVGSEEETHPNIKQGTEGSLSPFVTEDVPTEGRSTTESDNGTSSYSLSSKDG